MKYSRDIDGLRAIAVLSVVLFHLGIEQVSGGFIGVDVFFTISGYLITSIILKDIAAGRFSILRFWQRRARRILPAMFALVCTCLLASWLILFPVELILFGESSAAALLFASNFLFWSETGYFDLASELKPLLHTWSLAVEEQFYLVIPWLLLISYRAGQAALKMIFAGFFCISFALAVYWVNTDVEFAFYMPHTRAWELLMGSLLAIGFMPNVQSQVTRELMVVTGLTAIVFASLSFSSATPFPGLAAIFPTLGTALIITATNSGTTRFSSILASKPLVSVGLISYSLYLWHWPLIVYARYITGDELTPLLQIFIVVLSFILAWSSWRWVEMPVRQSEYWWGRKLLVGCVTITAVLAISSIILVAQTGAPYRFNADYQSVFKLQYENHDRRECHFVNVIRVDQDSLCIRGAEGAEPSFVLAGDSHADTMSTPVFAAAKELGIAGYQFTQAGFRPLPGVKRLGKERSGLLSERFALFLEENPSVGVVILHAFWKLQVTGSTFRHKGFVYTDENYDGTGVEYNATSFAKGLDRLVKRFPDKKFVLLEDIPSGAEFDLNRLLRILYFSDSEVAQIDEVSGIPRSQYQADLDTYRQIIDDQISADNLQRVSLADVLCDTEFCYGTREDDILYRDGDHLTLAGAALFVDYFINFFEQVLIHDSSHE
ncbi:MAG: acyltransferase [Gammaproteobacteria bacterium]|nr:acyltransferase [Gammaproteobacteria bacterium]MCP4090239.1 acyltransferase [Gammaproteobacteria bacterium]MCP4276344.1 acyltransferase [Gammaproteobacteria bacterium]MCP4831183.1 acyltransferase [Gammaproteobacteria bacterium]MCP4930111.1 acyltransferase [Gammaproteobacteria bacterium]